MWSVNPITRPHLVPSIIIRGAPSFPQQCGAIVIQRDAVVAFLTSCSQIPGQYFKLDHERFLPCHFHSVVHYAAHLSTWMTSSSNKQTTNKWHIAQLCCRAIWVPGLSTSIIDTSQEAQIVLLLIISKIACHTKHFYICDTKYCVPDVVQCVSIVVLVKSYVVHTGAAHQREYQVSMITLRCK